MSGTIVKICGVRSPEIARAVAGTGADLMGLIFARSRRRVTEAEARAIVEALGGSDHRPGVVGVFVNESTERMNAIAASVGLDYIQLSGDESVEVQSSLERPTIRALRLPEGMAFDEVCRVADTFLDCPAPACALLLDTHVAGVYGGTGKRGDWDLAARLAERYPVILAGGNRPETIVEAIETVRPFGVDVSSGVETDGAKDPEKIRRFVSLARQVDRTGKTQNVVASRR